MVYGINALYAHGVCAALKCIELPKTPRQPIAKGKKQDKKANKGKDQEVIYDYHDGAIHDIALKTHLLRGYEQFKVGIYLPS